MNAVASIEDWGRLLDWTWNRRSLPHYGHRLKVWSTKLRPDVVNDPSFGWIGYGCRVENEANEVRVFPKDGVRKRLLIVPDKLQVILRRGEIKSLTFDRRTSAVSLQIEDTTGMVKIVSVTIEGLEPGEYLLRTENSERRTRGSEKLGFEVPVEEANSLHISRAE